MLTPPESLDQAALLAALATGWGLSGRLDYRPVGWGSHHYSLDEQWFVTVDELPRKRQQRLEPLDLAFDQLARSLTTARRLFDNGLDFVVAPLPARDGSPVARLGPELAVHVYPFVVGQSFDWGEWASPDHHRAALDMVIRVHQAVGPGPAAEVEPIPYRDELTEAMSGLTHDCGPFAQRATELIAAHSVGLKALLRRYDELVERCDPRHAVLTHGEPHPGNTMLTDTGWLLIDWDTARVAAPERDLWSLADNESLLADYARATGFQPRTDVLELYRIRWDLADIAGDVSRFRARHVGTADDVETWRLLSELVAQVS